MAGMAKALRVLIVIFSLAGLFTHKHTASAQSATNLPKPISHPTICREWGNVAMGIFARYQMKYRNISALFASQARDEERDARSKGWPEANVRHLLEVVANAQSGRWSDAGNFGEDEFNECIEKWKASTTPAERVAENKAVEKYNAAIRATEDGFGRNVSPAFNPILEDIRKDAERNPNEIIRCGAAELHATRAVCFGLMKFSLDNQNKLKPHAFDALLQECSTMSTGACLVIIDELWSLSRKVRSKSNVALVEECSSDIAKNFPGRERPQYMNACEGLLKVFN